MTMDTREAPPYRMLRINPASGAVLFEFSPVKLKEYVYEMYTHMTPTSCLLNDISFSNVPAMASMTLDDLGERTTFGTGLCAILNHKGKEEERLRMLREIWRELVNRPEHAALCQEVEK